MKKELQLIENDHASRMKEILDERCLGDFQMAVCASNIQY